MLPDTSSRTAGKVLSRQVKTPNSTSLSLNYPKAEADGIRRAVQAIRLQGDREPPMSMIARRSIRLYLDMIENDPQRRAIEIAALEKLATPIATRTKRSDC